MKNLIVLCADKKIEAAVSGLLRRPQALAIAPIDFEIKVHPQHDPGCYHQAPAFLRPLRRSFEHALVVFDRAWDGAPSQSADELAEEVRQALAIDWREAADVVVIDPELEAWAWSDSPHVDEVLGWKDKRPGLREWLQREGLLGSGQVKPADPKAAIEKAVVKAQRRWTAGTCKTLAAMVGLERCQDRSFGRFRHILQAWFRPAGQP